MRIVWSLKQKIIEKLNQIRNQNGISIYMFHRVSREICSAHENISISLEAFRKFIERKRKQDWNFLNMEKLKAGDSYCEKNAVITFDDMFEDAYENAIPVLREYGIPYTVFIAPALVGTSGYISEEQLQALKEDELCTIGAHSISHKILRKLSLNEKKKEIALCENEKMLGCTISYFAYPYGSIYACDRKSQLLVKEEYKLGFSTLNFRLTQQYMKKKFFFIPRINVNNDNFLKV